MERPVNARNAQKHIGINDKYPLFYTILPQANLHKCIQHKCNGIPFSISKPIPCVQTEARTDSDINRRSAGMRRRLKGQAFNCVRLHTLNGT